MKRIDPPTMYRHPIYQWNQIRKEPLTQEVKRSRGSCCKAIKSTFSRPAHASTSVSLRRNLSCVPIFSICRMLLVCHVAGRAKELICWYLMIALSALEIQDISDSIGRGIMTCSSWHTVASKLLSNLQNLAPLIVIDCTQGSLQIKHGVSEILSRSLRSIRVFLGDSLQLSIKMKELSLHVEEILDVQMSESVQDWSSIMLVEKLCNRSVAFNFAHALYVLTSRLYSVLWENNGEISVLARHDARSRAIVPVRTQSLSSHRPPD